MNLVRQKATCLALLGRLANVGSLGGFYPAETNLWQVISLGVKSDLQRLLSSAEAALFTAPSFAGQQHTCPNSSPPKYFHNGDNFQPINSEDTSTWPIATLYGNARLKSERGQGHLLWLLFIILKSPSSAAREREG